jgi:hypothetical protein
MRNAAPIRPYRRHPAHAFLERGAPSVLRSHGGKLLWVGQKAVEDRQQCVARLVAAAADRASDVGDDLAFPESGSSRSAGTDFNFS